MSTHHHVSDIVDSFQLDTILDTIIDTSMNIASHEHQHRVRLSTIFHKLIISLGSFMTHDGSIHDDDVNNLLSACLETLVAIDAFMSREHKGLDEYVFNSLIELSRATKPILTIYMVSSSNMKEVMTN